MTISVTTEDGQAEPRPEHRSVEWSSFDQPSPAPIQQARYLLVRDAAGRAGLYDLDLPRGLEQLRRRCGDLHTAPVREAWLVTGAGEAVPLIAVVGARQLDRTGAGRGVTWSFVDATWKTVVRVELP